MGRIENRTVDEFPLKLNLKLEAFADQRLRFLSITSSLVTDIILPCSAQLWKKCPSSINYSLNASSLIFFYKLNAQCLKIAIGIAHATNQIPKRDALLTFASQQFSHPSSSPPSVSLRARRVAALEKRFLIAALKFSWRHAQPAHNRA